MYIRYLSDYRSNRESVVNFLVVDDISLMLNIQTY